MRQSFHFLLTASDHKHDANEIWKNMLEKFGGQFHAPPQYFLRAVVLFEQCEGDVLHLFCRNDSSFHCEQ